MWIKIIIKPKSLNLKRRAITIGKILKEKEKITSDGRQSATKAQDQRAPQSGAVSGKKTVFLRSFTISKRLRLGLVAAARILRRGMFDLFADEEEVLLVFRDVVFLYCFHL